MPSPPRGPVAERGLRLGARLIDAILELVTVIVTLVAFGSSDRPAAALALAWFVVALYETATTARFGATPGKLIVGTRVIAIGEVGHPPLVQAAKRGAVVATFTVLAVIGWAIWLSSTLTDALARGIADRAADTMVVPKTATLPIAQRDLPGYADGARAPRFTPLGRVGDLDVRVRARLRRLADTPVLAAAIGLLALLASLPVSTLTILMASSAAWIVVFVIDETRRVARDGATAGHRMAGLIIVDRRRATPPSRGRSFARALVLGLTLYVPLLWPLLAITLIMVRFGADGRGLHDVAGGTVVVADPQLDPETQRQRAMRMRLGRAA